jgi:hypothetical protein
MSSDENPAPGMTSLDRVMHLARSHDYRVGLQVGEHSGQIVLAVRDMRQERPGIAILAPSIDKAADALFAEMLRRQYVPRGESGLVA